MEISAICKLLQFKGEFLSCEILQGGNINTTYKVTCDFHGVKIDYLLQRINKNVYKNPRGEMDNILKVTDYINSKPHDKGFSALKFNRCDDGVPYVIDENGDYWRAREFVDCLCFNITDNLFVVSEAGKAFGEFQYLLDGFPVEELFESIPNFHNTVKRYVDLEKAVLKDSFNRTTECEEEIKFLLSNKDTASLLVNAIEKGEIPIRVTHNDTKCNNVIFDKNTLKALAVIDLDTIMPGITAYDFGDGARSICCTSLEDEHDLTKVNFDLERFEAFTKGYLHHLSSIISKNELNSLVNGVIIMTIELASRFLEDYLNGDVYFKTHYPKQNLFRARCQIALAKDIISKSNEIQNIVLKYSE